MEKLNFADYNFHGELEDQERDSTTPREGKEKRYRRTTRNSQKIRKREQQKEEEESRSFQMIPED